MKLDLKYFHRLCTGEETENPVYQSDDIEKLKVLSGVKKFQVELNVLKELASSSISIKRYTTWQMITMRNIKTQSKRYPEETYQETPRRVSY